MLTGKPKASTLRERAKLIEAAMRSSHPQAFLMGMQSTFKHACRYEDFSTAAMLWQLFAKGEIERVLYLKRQWQLGDLSASKG